MSAVSIILLSVLGLFVLITFFGFFVITQQKDAKIVQRFGKFRKICKAGISFKTPFIDSVAGTQSLRVMQLDVDVDTITKDKVSIVVKISVQYFVKADDLSIQKSFYELTHTKQQISSYVFDEVRAKVPTLELDQVFEEKEKISNDVKKEVFEGIKAFGFEILKVLVTDIQPDKKVVEAMNEINAQKRNKVAAEEKGEAEKILRVKQAEAEATSKKLQGEGIANQRKAIANGLKDSVELLKGTGISEREASAMIVITQHYDTLEAIGSKSKSNLILLPNSPGAATEMFTQLVAALQTDKSLSAGSEKTEKPEDKK